MAIPWRSARHMLVADLLLVAALFAWGKPAETVLTIGVAVGLLSSWCWFLWALVKGRGRLHRINP